MIKNNGDCHILCVRKMINIKKSILDYITIVPLEYVVCVGVVDPKRVTNENANTDIR